MKTILKNKKGVTLLEGLIAMGLLAMVAAGTFGVLLSVSHKSNQPDIREEMAFSIEKANDWLQAYSQNMEDGFSKNANTLCNAGEEDPLSNGKHNVECLLPYVCVNRTTNVDSCSAEQSCFWYEVSTDVQTFDFTSKPMVVKENFSGGETATNVPQRKIIFKIQCNGFSL